MGSSSSICSLLVATTLGVIVPDRDEKTGWGGDDIGREGRGEVAKSWKAKFEKLKIR